MVDQRQYILFPRVSAVVLPARLMCRHFNPGLWPSLAGLVLFLLLIRLGFWQLDRAEEKQALQTRYQDQISAEPVNLGQAARHSGQAQHMYWRRCILTGSYDPQVLYLLDNQVWRGVVGYQVFSRFVLPDGASVLVDRGWVAATGSRSEAPEIHTTTEPVTLTGVAKPAPVSGIRLKSDVAEKLGGNLVRVQRIDLAQIGAHNNWKLLPYVVRLDPPATDGMSWNGTAPGFGRERHLGYAFQWFALATTLLVIYIVVNMKKRTGPGADNT